MKVSIKWLKDYVDINIPADELANRLTMAGNEVASVKVQGANWGNVFVGQLTAVNPHPNADRLRLATVNLGKEQHTVVCGAPNLTPGDKICFATVGAELLDGHSGQMMKLKPAKIRGVESKGMVCSEMELDLSQNHEGILILPADAPVGTPLSDYLGDAVIDLEVTPNRPDCLSVIGIARETAALTGQKVHISPVCYPESALEVESKIAVEIQAPDLCPRYSASLITGIKVKPSPQWMQDRLTACGMRPINNIVDISNYVMLEYGQPLHTFDYDKIAGPKIIVRRAGEGEPFTSLDGVERRLSSKMLVICDAVRSVAIAGVMGGSNSEVTDQTVNILLEAANFKPSSIYLTGTALGLISESRYRFERGISVEMTIPALKRATQLIAELGEGQAAKNYIDVYPGQKPVEPISLSITRTKNLLGIDINMEKVATVAIPFAKGHRPYETVAFQFSHHVMQEDGRVEHRTQFLEATPGVDPCVPFLRALRDALAGDDGTVFRWATHENTVLNHLRRQLLDDPKPPVDAAVLVEFIDTITMRKDADGEVIGPRNMVDLCKLAERYFFHPATKGSSSLKKVLPALMQSSALLRELYRQPAYGSPNMPSLNLAQPMAWWVEQDGQIQDPYSLLPPVFGDFSPEEVASIEAGFAPELQEGGAAMAAYARLQFEEIDPMEREAIQRALLRYCELDTLAMVMTAQAWRGWADRLSDERRVG